MNAGSVSNIKIGKTSVKGLNVKDISIIDFRKLISEFFIGKKSKTEMEKGEDIINIFMRQLSTPAFSENKDIDLIKNDISSFISKLSLEDIKPMLSEKFISTEDFKKKLTEFISKIQQDDEKQDNGFKTMEDYGNFKKTVLLNKKNQLSNIKEEPTKITSKILKSQPKAESTIDTKETPPSKDTFSIAVTKIQLKNASITNDSKLPEVRKESINEDLVKTVSFMKNNGVKSLTVKVVPKEMGQITIELVYTGDKISGKLTPTTNSTFQILDQNISLLNSELLRSGINVQNLTVNLYPGDSSKNQGENQKQNDKRREEKRKIQEIDEEKSIDEFGNINIFA